MTNLSRRSFTLAGLGTTATLGIGATVTPVAAASHAPVAPPAMFDAPTGKYRVTSIFDGMVPLAKNLFSDRSRPLSTQPLQHPA